MKRISSILLILTTILCFSACNKKNANELNADDIYKVCEMATVKCYYNNVAQIEKKKDNIFQKERKMWIEYEGEVVLGVKMSKLDDIVIDHEKCTVEIVMPEAEILSIGEKEGTLNKESYIASADGILFKNKITTEDQEAAVIKGEEEMKKVVNENKALFKQAKEKAKDVIENYIAKIGKLTGKEYEVIWK